MKSLPPMHELAICQAIIAEVEVIAASRSARAVRDVYLRIGPLSGVEPRLLCDAFPFAAAGTVAAEAALHVTSTAVRVRCSVCGAEMDVPANCLLCTECAGWRTELLSGDELLLERVELLCETEDRSRV